jgi:hypothetical protein
METIIYLLFVTVSFPPLKVVLNTIKPKSPSNQALSSMATPLIGIQISDALRY